MALDSICIYTGASAGTRPEYLNAARAVGGEIATRGMTMVYGGGHVGLMGAAADAALEAGGKVVGVIPADIADREVEHHGLTELLVVDSMHERKMAMLKRADAMIALPGGLGTMEELFEVWTWNQLGFHRKPVGLFNVQGYYDKLLQFLDHMVAEQFVKPVHHELLIVDTDYHALLDRMVEIDSASGA
ncbi:MAG: TIGR00730 family Rossman fold protein [Halioglobus sp.]